MTKNLVGRLDHLTFKGNLAKSRYGWLRLTPAYSVHLVEELLDAEADDGATVLDPFCGTGTTALVCAERGIPCTTTDINPFLLWLAGAKCARYTPPQIDLCRNLARQVTGAIVNLAAQRPWTPPIHQIEKWWDERALLALGRALAQIKQISTEFPTNSVNLLLVAFCRTMIDVAHVSFGHQSMSFKRKEVPPILALIQSEEDAVAESWERSAATVMSGGATEIAGSPDFVLCDARDLKSELHSNRYSCVITSPPYPNRMSYIRELRPYMYWLGYLAESRAAGELDWKAIGGTWGCATSNLTRWEPEAEVSIPFGQFAEVLDRIAERSGLLSRYVHRYFCDMVGHVRSLFQVVQPGGAVHYIVGNSKFYDVMLPVEAIFAALFKAAGFSEVSTKVVRKRTSKKELFEFLVSARKPNR
ncbi:MAG TPA: DNA methyltransferase [Pirellulales bacterium]|nr:DNA methyltransferase [Pirellulales bacterium]